MSDFVFHPLHQWPIAAVLAVQAQAYAAHLIEQAEVLQGKIHSSTPQQALSWGVARAAAPEVLCGYAIACPWRSDAAPLLDHAAAQPLAQADCLYVHDIAIAPSCHGQGLAAQLIDRVLQQGSARGWQQAVLVAVQGAQRYWAQHGFVQQPGSEVSSFGADAVWMARALPPQQ